MNDPRTDAFLSPEIEVFHSVEHRHEIWKEDPFDVETLQAEARAVFQRLLLRATTPPGLESGRILLLLGESGSGKTHLVRAFRNHVHAENHGFVGYMQMTTSAQSWGRYLLSNLIDSLDQPYYASHKPESGLVHLAGALAARGMDRAAAASLRNDPELDAEQVHEAVSAAADRLVQKERYSTIDIDLLRALLYLHRSDPRLKSRVLKYLRCEDMSIHDRAVLGHIVPRTAEDDPARMVEMLGRTMWAVHQMSLVLCIDQLEDIGQIDATSAAPFRRAMTTVCALADRVPSSIVVVCCLETFYKGIADQLTRSLLDRLEKDPEPVRLAGACDRDEVERVIAARLRFLFETAGAPVDDGAPLFPVPPSLVARATGLRMRDVLHECRLFRERCIAAGRIVDDVTEPERLPVDAPPIVAQGASHPPLPDNLSGPDPKTEETPAHAGTRVALEQLYNDFLAAYNRPLPDEDEAIAELLGWAIAHAGDELETNHTFQAVARGTSIEVTARAPSGGAEALWVGVCNKSTRGGGLGRQIEALVKEAKGRIPVVVRTDEFPSGAGTVVASLLGDLITRGGRRVTLPLADLRTMAAFRAFRAAHDKDLGFVPWMMAENHLSRLGSIAAILDLERLDRLGPAPAPPPIESRRAAPRPQDSRAPAPAPAPAATRPPPLFAGVTGSLVPHDVTIEVAELSQHAAFLGASGSGKTTAALSLVEQLLCAGVPVVLVDRKGDLAGYARSGVWAAPAPDPSLDERRRALRDRVDVALFTPGHAEGRPLSIAVVPDGLSTLPEPERDATAEHAAHALAGMLGYRDSGPGRAQRAILVQACRLLAAHAELSQISLEQILRLLDPPDAELLAAIGRLDVKLFDRLVQDIEALKLTSLDLFAEGPERLDAELLLGLGKHARPGKTRLSVVSTKFLRDPSKSLFWVAQLLLAMSRWASQHPSPSLQAALLLDEADIYLPALEKPPTKAPLEDLLRRGRSAGLGLLLCTQSPGDLEYRCRDQIRSWFLGRIKEPTALAKLRPMLAETAGDVGARLPGQATGEMVLVRERSALSLRTSRSVLVTTQLADSEILALARASARPSG